MRTLILLTILLNIIVFCLTNCTDNITNVTNIIVESEKKLDSTLVGVWSDSTTTASWIFNSDSTFTSNFIHDGYWYIDGPTLILESINIDGDSEFYAGYYYYYENRNDLFLMIMRPGFYKEGEYWIYQRILKGEV